MWYGEMCVHLYDLLDVLAAKATTMAAAKAKTKATAPTDETATTAARQLRPLGQIPLDGDRIRNVF
mgnify:CR=1 FL=1